MSDFDSSGKGGKRGGKGGSVWDHLRTIGQGVLEGFAGGGKPADTSGKGVQRSVSRSVSRQDPLTSERRVAASQVKRSLRAWRDRQDAEGGATGVQRKPQIPSGGGAPLPGPVKSKMEGKLGANLSDVKIHTGGDSEKASEDLNAKAFTVGNDVHFGSGQFDPSSKEGEKLIAHELTHVVQGQRGGGDNRGGDAQRAEENKTESEGEAIEGADGEALEVSNPDEPAEKEADEVSEKVVEGEEDQGAEVKPVAAPQAARSKISLARAADDPLPARKLHDSVRSTFNDIRSYLKQGKVKTTLGDGAELALLGLAVGKIEGDWRAVETSYNTNETAYTAMLATPNAATIATQRQFYEALKPRAEEIRGNLEDVSKGQPERDAAAVALRAQIRGAAKRADDLLKESKTQQAIALPSFAGLKTAIETKQPQVAALIEADNGNVRFLSQLRSDLTAADSLRQDAERAQKIADVNSSMRPPIAKIGDICKNTTKEGRPEAGEGDGSAEAAAIAEAARGTPTGPVGNQCWHGPKCAMEAAGIESAIRILTDLRTLTDEAALHEEIDAAVVKGTDRMTKLRAGADAWVASEFVHLAPIP